MYSSSCYVYYDIGFKTSALKKCFSAISNHQFY